VRLVEDDEVVGGGLRGFELAEKSISGQVPFDLGSCWANGWHTPARSLLLHSTRRQPLREKSLGEEKEQL